MSASASHTDDIPHSRAGDVFQNLVTGERAVVIAGSADSTDGSIAAHLFVPPGATGPGPHYHPSSAERLRVLSGRVALQLGDEQLELGPGADVTINAGAVHQWRNAGRGEAQLLVQLAPGRRIELVLATMFGLANEGRTDSRGRPRLLQRAVIAKEFRDVLVFVHPPNAVQALAFGLLAPLGRLLGYRAYDRRFLEPAYRERPDRSVSELVHGRVRRLRLVRPQTVM